MSGEYIKMTIKRLLETHYWPDNMGDLHRLINIFDAKKDAFHATTTISRDASTPPYINLINAIRKMVGDTMLGQDVGQFLDLGSDRDLKALEEYVLPSLDKIKAGSASVSGFSTTLGEAPTPISMLKSNVQLSNVQLISPIIPEEIVNAIVDAAANPKQYNTNITIVETPSQFSDPGTRPEPGFYYPRNGTPIYIDLSSYGFAPNSTFTARFNHTDDPITATIDIVLNGITINVTIDRNGKYDDITINDVVYDYAHIQAFAGNPTKNAFINGMDNTDGTHVLFAIVYVLCKEIGDTIQVLMLLILFRIIGGELNSSNTLIFTPDIVFAMRCRIVGIPCLLKKMVKDSVYRSLLHYTGMADPNQQRRAINVCYKEQCKSQNNGINISIARLIAENRFSLGGSVITLTPKGAEYLQTISERIGVANYMIDQHDVTMATPAFRALCSENIAFNLFGKSGGGSVLKPNMSIKQLFPSLADNRENKNNVSFGKGFAYELLERNGGSRGGSLTKKYKGGGVRHKLSDLLADFYDLCYPYLLYFGANYVDNNIFNLLRTNPTLLYAESIFNYYLNNLDYEPYVEDNPAEDNYTDDRNIITEQVYNDIKEYITAHHRKERLKEIFGNTSKIIIKTNIRSMIRDAAPQIDYFKKAQSRFRKVFVSEPDAMINPDRAKQVVKKMGEERQSIFLDRRRNSLGGSLHKRKNKPRKITQKRSLHKKYNKTLKKNKHSARKTRRRRN